jgi:peroxiredoxin
MTADMESDDPADFQGPDDIDGLVEQLRRSGLPLGKQLGQLNARLEQSEPEYVTAYDQLVARLAKSHAGIGAPQVGAPMPEFLLPDDDGHLVSLATLRASGPVVVAFLRGHWCPYCRLNAAALAGLEHIIAPAQIVAISAETSRFARLLREESGASFPFLTDVGNGYALSLGLSFWVGETLAEMLRADACDIPTYHATQGWFLPIPAVFVVGRNGLVQDRYVNPDFRQRMEIDALRRAALAASATDG